VCRKETPALGRGNKAEANRLTSAAGGHSTSNEDDKTKAAFPFSVFMLLPEEESSTRRRRRRLVGLNRTRRRGKKLVSVSLYILRDVWGFKSESESSAFLVTKQQQDGFSFLSH